MSVELPQPAFTLPESTSLVVESSLPILDAPEHHDGLPDDSFGPLDSFAYANEPLNDNLFADFLDLENHNVFSNDTLSFTDHAPQLGDFGAAIACDGSAPNGV